MNISFKTAEGTFSLRAAALVIDKGRILLAKNNRHDCFYTVGGGVQVNETSSQAVLRELFEETGYSFEIDRLVFVQERYFQVGTSRYHEVVFFYLMIPIDFEIPDGVNTDQREEHLYWIPLNELQEINLAPEFLKTALQSIPKEVVHIVSHDL